MDEEYPVTIMITRATDYAGPGMLTSLDDKLEFKFKGSLQSLDSAVVVYNEDATVHSLRQYQLKKMSETERISFFGLYRRVMDGCMRNDSDFKDILYSGLSQDVRHKRYNELIRRHPVLRDLTNLLEGDGEEMVSEYVMGEHDWDEDLPSDVGRIIVASYVLAKHVQPQVPESFIDIRRKLGSIVSFVPISYLDRTHDFHGLEE